MGIVNRSARMLSSFLLVYGPPALKKRVWDKRFATGQWNFIDHTEGDCVYPVLQRYSLNGSILDLGCGPGNTANEMESDSYRSYVGLDISEEALVKGRRRSEENGRGQKNRFVQSDFLSFEPTEKFDVVLFRESMYHIPLEKIRPLLDKYSKYLTQNGVFIVRLYTMRDGKVISRPNKMIEIIAANYPVVEKGLYGNAGAVVIVFRPRNTLMTP
jgi:SAM-dependent methyltransferase